MILKIHLILEYSVPNGLIWHLHIESCVQEQLWPFISTITSSAKWSPHNHAIVSKGTNSLYNRVNASNYHSSLSGLGHSTWNSLSYYRSFVLWFELWLPSLNRHWLYWLLGGVQGACCMLRDGLKLRSTQLPFRSKVVLSCINLSHWSYWVRIINIHCWL